MKSHRPYAAMALTGLFFVGALVAWRRAANRIQR